MDPDSRILAVNSGSSSVKLALIDPRTGERDVDALAERVGTPEASITLVRASSSTAVEAPVDASHAGVVTAMIDALSPQERNSVAAIGNRVVHGGPEYCDPVAVDDSVLDGLIAITELAPMHIPGNVGAMRAARVAFPGLPGFAVFDTGFHRTMPPHAYRYAVPNGWHEDLGVRRYGFHGISHRFVAGRAAESLGSPLTELQLITVHLGNGCSACAVRDGASVDTTMGFTPLEGLMMGTRSGDIDAGALAFVGKRLGLGLDDVVSELSTASGLLGVSGISNDMRTLLQAEADGSQAATLAIDLFCYRAAKAICGMAAALTRIDAIVFTGGIGEHSEAVRGRITAHLAVLGVDAVMTIPTDEELAIARDVAALLDGASLDQD